MFPFNIRVYGILINENKEVLVSDEYIRGGYYTKFPGGGLEFGEGTRDCLKRELKEELGIETEIGEHIYTTDFFQLSAFHPGHQIISIYYLVSPLEELRIPLKKIPFDFDKEQMAVYEKTGETETFRLIPLSEISEDAVTLPIDKKVTALIKEKLSSS